MPRRMTDAERDEYLAGANLAVLSIAWDGRGPLAIPIWFEHVDGTLRFVSAADSLKTRLIDKAGRASLCVHDNSRPYWYLTAEGPVTFRSRTHEDAKRISARYLGSQEAGQQYADGVTWAGVLGTLTPDTWLTRAPD